MAADAQRVLALVPMKPLEDAKSRLGPDVPARTRAAVAAAMFERVLGAAVTALGPDGCWVIGGDGVIQGIAEEAEASWRAERGKDLNGTLWFAMQDAYRDGYQAALFLPSDVPQASAEDIRAVASRLSEGRPAGVRAERDGGTNALLMPAPCAFAPLLGPDSFARHSEASERQGTPLIAVEAPGLARDVDSTEDLAWAYQNVDGFREAVAGWEARLCDAPSARGALER
ncbi:MAG: 2-phospho-L-lactate guanylyltransferase [Dehalococcoidia bacterium]